MFNIPKSIFIILFLLLMPLNMAFQFTIYAQNNNKEINQKDSNGLKQGLWVYTDQTGKITTKEGHYSNDLKNGVWISYYNNKAKKSEITYINGDASGQATFYYENGKIRESGNWHVDHWVGKYKYYYESGQLSYDWNYNKEGKRNGEQNYFHKNGNKMYNGVWNDGKTEGTLKVFDEKGILTQEKQYDHGKFACIKKITDSKTTNQEKSITTIKESDIPMLKFDYTGNYSIINIVGKITTKGYFVKGKLFTGEKFNYDQNGKLISITYYENNKEKNTVIK